MKGFALMVIEEINEVELDIALDLAPSNMTKKQQIDQEIFNLLPPNTDLETKQSVRHLLELLHT